MANNKNKVPIELRGQAEDKKRRWKQLLPR